jgi:hypothetical protein
MMTVAFCLSSMTLSPEATFRGGYNLHPRSTVSFRDVSWSFDFDQSSSALGCYAFSVWRHTSCQCQESMLVGRADAAHACAF